LEEFYIALNYEILFKMEKKYALTKKNRPFGRFKVKKINILIVNLFSHNFYRFDSFVSLN